MLCFLRPLLVLLSALRVDGTGDRLWFEFVNKDIKAKKLGQDVLLDLRGNKKDEVCFDSVGELNCVDDTQILTSFVPPPEYDRELGREFDNIPQAMYYIFLLVFWITIVTVLFAVPGSSGKRIQLFNVLQVLVGIVAGVKFFKFSYIIGLTVMLVALVIFVGLNLDELRNR